MNKYIVYKDGDSVFTMLDRLVATYQKDVKELGSDTPPFRYHLAEYSPVVDTRGREIPVKSYRFQTSTIVKLQKDSLGSSSFNTLVREISTTLGVPTLQLNIEHAKLLQVPSMEIISAEKTVYSKRSLYEIKRAKELCESIEDAQSPETLGGLDVCEWMYNKGKGRSAEEILIKYYELRVREDRERIYHMRQMPNARLSHKCHDASISEGIKVIDKLTKSSVREFVSDRYVIHG